MARKNSRESTARRRESGVSPIEAFLALPDAEKERQTSAFDREFAADAARPLTPAQRNLWKRAKRKRGRPKTGQGVRTISLSVEKGLLRRADALAKRRKITRAALVAEGLKAVLAKAG
jgi:hypothetical protein